MTSVPDHGRAARRTAERAVLTLTLAFLVHTPHVHAQSAASDTVIVFDGSGSMWGRVDGGEVGPTKIEVARDTLAEVLGGIDDTMRLGLVAYGHQFSRREQNCQDIQTMVPVGPAQSSVPAMLEAARSITPKGMTPLTDAVRVAAEGMRYTERPATVVLVTDGIESCNGDPCALAAELERFGIDFTAHVVGFGLDPSERAQVQCLADGTGGKYFDAGDGQALQTALTDALVRVEPEPEPEPVETIPPELAIFLWADPEKTRLLEAGRNGYDYARLYRAEDLEGWSPTDGFPAATELGMGLTQFYARPDGQSLIPEVRLDAPTEGDYVLVSRFSGISEPTYAASTIAVRPGMDAVVDVVAGIAYIEPEMLTADGQELITGSGSFRDPATGQRFSYGYTTRKYYPVVNGVRADESAVSGKFGPIPSGEYEMVLQMGGAVHRERLTLEPGDDHRPKITIAPIVTAKVEVIDQRGTDLNDGYQTYTSSCPVQPRDTDGNLTDCGAWGESSITGARGATFFRPGPQVVVFESRYADKRAEQIVDIPADATAETFTITMLAGQTADVGQTTPADSDPTVENGEGSSVPGPSPEPPHFGEGEPEPVVSEPTLPERVFLRVYEGSVDGTLLNDSTYKRSTGSGNYLGTWVYRAEDLVAPDASTLPILDDRETVREPIPAEYGGDGAPDRASFPTIATKGAMREGDYVALSSFEVDGTRVNLQTPFSVSMGTDPVIDLILGEGAIEEEAPPAPPIFGKPAEVDCCAPEPLPFVVTDPERQPVEEPTNVDNEETSGFAQVTVTVLGADGAPIRTPYNSVLCEDRERDADDRLQGCGDVIAAGTHISVPVGKPVIIGAWNEAAFGASKVVTVPPSADGQAFEVVMTSTERARE